METNQLLKESLAAFRAGDLALARDICETIQGREAGEPGSLRLLGQISYLEGDVGAAIAMFEKSLKAKPEQYSIWVKLGNAYGESGELKKAEIAYTKALDCKGDKHLAYFWRAQIRAAAGKEREAFSDLDSALKENPYFGQVYRLMIVLGHPAAKGRKFADELEHKLSLKLFGREDAIQVHYALANYFEDEKTPKKMWFHLHRANALQKNITREWAEGYRGTMNRTKEIFTADFLANAIDETHKKITPVLIVGIPRSGSTLLERMLAGHSKIAAAGEYTPLPRVIGMIQKQTLLNFPNGFETFDRKGFPALSALYQEGLGEKAGDKPFVTDKLLSNAFFLGLVKLLTPWAKVIHIRREPMDAAFSIYKNYFWEVQTPEYCSLKSIGTYARMSEEIMSYWKKLMPGMILDVSYESLTRSPEDELKKVLSFLGLEWDANCLDYEKRAGASQTLSEAQVKKPLYTSSIGIAAEHSEEMKPFLETYKAN